jgi:4'-phosphopantetheinyl transferase
LHFGNFVYMPQIKEVRIDNDSLWGLWQISENSQELEKTVSLNLHEAELLSGLRNETRRLHWLSYRILIRKLIGNNDVNILYFDSGKPYITKPSGHISVTHSGAFSAVIYSSKSPVGIDIERIQDRIDRVSHKFLSEKELQNLCEKKRTQHLVTLWAAKEALYKLWGKTEVDFRENLYIEPFHPDMQGEFKGFILDNKFKNEYTLHYSLVEDYVLVWVKE